MRSVYEQLHNYIYCISHKLAQISRKIGKWDDYFKKTIRDFDTAIHNCDGTIEDLCELMEKFCAAD